MRRRIYLPIAVLVAIVMMTLTVCAEEIGMTVDVGDDEWEKFESSVPDEVRELLPEGTLDGSEDFALEATEMSDIGYLSSVVIELVGARLGEATELFALILAAIVLSAVFGALGEGNDGGALSSAMRFCSVGAVISVMIYTLYRHFGMIERFFEQLSAAVGGMIPVTVSIWAMGGNVSTATVGNATFYVMLNVCQKIYASTVLPVCCTLTVLGVCDALSDDVRMGRMINAVKRTYNFILGAVMTLLLSSMAAQTAIAASADTVTARTARIVSGTVIPILGGGVGDTFRTLATGVTYLKNVFGIGGIIIIALLTLPLVISVLLTRFVLMLGAGIADMLGCGGQARLLESLCEVYGCILGVISSVAVMFVLSLCIFMQTVVAVM